MADRRPADKDTAHPTCLSLRGHSSILLPTQDDTCSLEDENENENENEMFLPVDVLRPTLKGTRISYGTNSNLQDNSVSISEENGEANHLFLMSQKLQYGLGEKEEITASATRRFNFRASRRRIVLQPTGDQLKHLGRRARARTQQQRKKRKEIKMIDDSCLMDQIEKPRKNVKPSNNNAMGKKRSRQYHSQAQLNSAKNVVRKTGQLWSPNIKNIWTPSKNDQSKYVQLHGLPVGTTYEIIKRFFIGLLPQRVILLLSNKIHIPVLDASSYDELPYNLQDLVYTSNDLRAFVKFDSISEASLAVDRSGETIYAKQLKTLYHRNGTSAFSVGVTIISKDLASSLFKLSVDVTPGIPLHACLLRVKSKLKPLIREILWTNIQRKHNLAIDSGIKSCNLHLDKNDNHGCHDRISLLTSYQKYASHYNRLLTIHKNLLTSLPPTYNNRSDDVVISIDPIARLTAQACNVLSDEMDRIDNFLYQVRTTRKMLKKE